MRAEGVQPVASLGCIELHPGSYAGMTRIRFEGFVSRHLRPAGHPPRMLLRWQQAAVFYAKYRFNAQ